ncbi:MAG: histidine phosphatase family protein [Mycoplasmoidaceae bacterium]|nr:histidine phosphatase family protein [Mycoplasmoidaceae bacterium]
MINVYFIRHFPTQSNIKNIWCGRGTDISINRDISIKLLKDDLLNEIGQIKFNFVFTSPLKRCIETCNMLGIKKFCVDQRLIEREFGSIEQKPCNEKDKRNLGD